MPTTKLERYNEALGHLEARKLASLSERRESRRVLDDYWDGVVAIALEKGFWNHAMRTVLIDASASIAPAFGYGYAFTRPPDWVRSFEFSASEHLHPPLLDRDLADEAGVWYADIDPLYARYVSSDTAYGLDLSLWGASFADYVSLALAVKACKRITGSDEMLQGGTGLIAREKKALAIAKSVDAMNEPVRFPPQGTWVGSRRANWARHSRWNGRMR